MLNEAELNAYCLRNRITPKARLVIDRVRTSPPTRRVQSGSHNVACRYASKKMGLVIQAESHKNELAAIIGWEHDAKTHEFYDQPPKVKLSYTGRTGKTVCHLATPDFFLLQEEFAGWVECKTEEWLQGRANEGSTLYIRDGKGGWRCPAGEDFAATLDLGFKVRSSSATQWTSIRNMEFLSDYLDERCKIPSQDAMQRVRNAMTGLNRPWIVLKDLLDALPPDDGDTLYKMIADGELFARLDKDLLTEPERTHIFRDKITADAYRLYLDSQTQTTLPALRTLTIEAGQSLHWDGRIWRILNVGDQDIYIEDQSRIVSIVGRKIFDQLVKEGAITGLATDGSADLDQAEQVVRRASPKDFEHAVYRYHCLYPESCDTPPKKSCSRARRKWRALFKRGQELYGSGLLGLISKTSQRGNRGRRLDGAVIQIMDEVINNDYGVLGGWSIPICWGKVVEQCEAKSLLPPSEVAFRAQISRRNQNDLVAIREGKKAAYSTSEFYWHLDSATPRHGERVFEFGHMDHTEMDLQFRGSRRGEKMGKAWLSVLIDAYTRQILAWIITFDPPSYRTCMALIRDCIERHGRVPKTIIVDKGPEFQSIYFETLLARLECHKKTRPGSKPRFGSLIERFFGMNNEQFVHCLLGNNVALQKPRSMSKSHDPRDLSVWTLPAFREAFDGYLEQVYGEMQHSALGMSPKEAVVVSLRQSGMRRHLLIPNTRELSILCLPSTPKGTAKVDPSRGVKIGYIYYWCQSFTNPKFRGCDVTVRYDPNDKSLAMAWLDDHWETCTSEYANQFRGRTEKEITLITQEITAQKKLTGKNRTINATLIAQYLTATQVTEKHLQQRLRDQENHASPLPFDQPTQAVLAQSRLGELEDRLWGDLEQTTGED